MSLELRLLSPAADLDLYKTAYNWRPRRKHHLQPDRLPFETFAADDPTHIIIGLFNGDFLAVYFLHEDEPGVFGVHMTSRRNVPRETLLTGAQEVIRCFFEGGATELIAWIAERNRPLRSFVESLGFVAQKDACQNDTDSSTLPSDAKAFIDAKAFVKYVIQRSVP